LAQLADAGRAEDGDVGLKIYGIQLEIKIAKKIYFHSDNGPFMLYSKFLQFRAL
jgi:hypothetical protein